MDFTRRRQVTILQRDVEIFLEECRGRAKRLACRIVQFRPRILPAGDQVGDEHARDRAVCHAITGVAGGDVRVVVARIDPDEGHRVDGLEHLARPAIQHVAHHGESRARPLLELPERLFFVVALARLVVLTTDDEDLVMRIQRCQPDVMIRIEVVPVEATRNRTLRNLHPDHVGAIRCLLGVDGHPVVHRRVRREDERVGPDRMAVRCLHLRAIVLFVHRVDVRAAEDAASIALDRLCERGDVFQRMKLRLVGKPDRRFRLERHIRDLGEELDARNSGAPGCFGFVRQVLSLAIEREPVAVQSFELAVDSLFTHDRFDAIDRRHVTLGSHSCAFRTMHFFDLRVVVVERADEVSSRPSGFAAGNRTIIEHNDTLSVAAEQVCCGDSGYAGANDTHVSIEIALQRVERRNV